jgi:predicted nucleotidyltransferase
VPPDELARRLSGLPSARTVTLAVLHGSRARGDARPESDWDVGVLTDGPADLAALTADGAAVVGTDAVDVVDLRRASALLRFRAARDGIALIERPPGAFEAFQLDAVEFWCDARPVIRAAQDDVLAELG